MKNLIKLVQISSVLLFLNTYSHADVTGLYLGGGVGAGMQKLSIDGQETTQTTPAVKAFVGYQFADWVGGEFGYTYITQADNWNNLGQASSTIYDIAFTPGFVIPSTPVQIYARLGVDAISSNLDTGWSDQLTSTMSTNFEYGLGVKVSIPDSRTFVRLEYANYGGVINNSNSNLSTTPSILSINAGYVF